MLSCNKNQGKRNFSGMINISSRLPSNLGEIRAKVSLKKRKIEKALVLWFSQTGNTEKVGIEILNILKENGIIVSGGEIRKTGIDKIKDTDLLVIGSPVFYYDIPGYVKKFIDMLPDLDGMAVAGYVTFGGENGNQHNALCSALEGLIEKNGVPVGMESFRSKNAFTIKPGKENSEFSDKTEVCRDFVFSILGEVERGKSLKFRKTLTLKESMISDGPFWWNKEFVTEHWIDLKKCNNCKKCVEICPSGSIDPESLKINHKSCTLCLGCINNCKEGAVIMKYNSKKVTGLPFLK